MLLLMVRKSRQLLLMSYESVLAVGLGRSVCCHHTRYFDSHVWAPSFCGSPPVADYPLHSDLP